MICRCHDRVHQLLARRERDWRTVSQLPDGAGQRDVGEWTEFAVGVETVSVLELADAREPQRGEGLLAHRIGL
jgi:hypothetical protein